MSFGTHINSISYYVFNSCIGLSEQALSGILGRRMTLSRLSTESVAWGVAKHRHKSYHVLQCCRSALQDA